MDALLMRARALTQAPDHHWAGLFRETFLQDIAALERLFGSGCSDDILFLVRDDAESAAFAPSPLAHRSLTALLNPTADVDPIQVLRKTSDACLPAIGDGGVKWRESFYLNLIACCHFELTVATYERSETGPPHLLRRVAKRVYASPVSVQLEHHEDGPVTTYPKIYFTVEDFDTAFSSLAVMEREVLSVDLHLCLPPMAVPPPPTTPPVAPSSKVTGNVVPTTVVVPQQGYHSDDGVIVSGDEPGSPSQPSLSPGTPSSAEFHRERQIAIFSGSIGYAKLASCFQVKQGRRVLRSKVEYINMVGPGRKGLCQVAVRDPYAAPSIPPAAATLHLMRKALFLLKADTAAEPLPPVLQTSLTFINVHWEAVITDLNSWLPDEAP